MSDQTLPYATPAAQPPRRGAGRQAFGVVVRTAGLLLVLYGLRTFLTPVYAWLGMVYDTRLNPENDAIEASVAVAVGVLLVRGGWLVRLAYGRDE